MGARPVKSFIRGTSRHLYKKPIGTATTASATLMERVMRKIYLALFVLAGLGAVGATITAASAACHNPRTSKWHTGVC